MIQKLILISGFGCLLMLSACAPVSQLPGVDPRQVAAEAEKQKLMVIEQLLADSAQITRVADRILKANVDLCGSRTVNRFGFTVMNAYALGPANAGLVRSLGYGNLITLNAVLNDSPAERAGLKGGDILIAIAGEAAPSGVSAVKDFFNILSRVSQSNAPLSLAVLRDSKQLNFTIQPVLECSFPIQPIAQNIVNAFADGNRVYIASGMMRFVNSDEELAIVMGHEIAHNILGHIDKQRGNAILGVLADILAAGAGVNTQGAFGRAGGMAFSQEFEAEADYVGLYLAARAGYEIHDSPQFWRRMGINNPASIVTNHAATHPSTPARFVALERTVEEISAKRNSGQALFPERK